MANDYTSVLKQINVDKAYWLDAAHLLDANGGQHTYEDIAAMIAAGFEIKVVTSLPTASASTMGKLYLVAESGTKAGTYVEYITVKGGTDSSPTYTWEKIGTTETDLSDYAKKTEAAKAGSITSDGSGQLSTNEIAAYNATVTISGITYDKSAATTGSAGSDSTTDNTSSVSGGTVNFSNAILHAEEDASVTVTIAKKSGASVAQHSYTPAGSITHATDTTATFVKTVGNINLEASSSKIADDDIIYVSDISGSDPSLGGQKAVPTNAIKSVALSASTTSTDGPVYVESVTLPTMTAISFTKNTLQSLTTKNYGFSASTSNIMSSPVVTNGVLSWTPVNATSQDVLSAGSQASLTGGVFTSGSKVDKYMKAAGTAADTANVTISGGSYSATKMHLGKTYAPQGGTTGPAITAIGALGFSGTAATLSHTVTDAAYTGSFTGDDFLYGDQFSITGTQVLTGHTHTYKPLTAHTHSITLTSASVGGSATAAVAKHSHTIASHTHGVNLPSIK